ncbi:MAG: lactonase family protein [Candidatus Limnocylindrales bacterium]
MPVALVVIGLLGGCSGGVEATQPPSGGTSSAPPSGATATTPATASAQGFAYVVNANGGGPGTVSQYAIGQNGTLTPLSVPTVATGGNNSQLIAVDPTSRYAYVSNVSSNTVAEFSIDPGSGALTPLFRATISMGSDSGVYYPWSIAVHPSGKWAYVSLGQKGKVNEYTIGSDGTLSPMDPPSVPAGGYPDTIALDPSGKHAYVSDGRENDVYQFTIDQASGALSPMTPATVPAGGSSGKENAWFIQVDPTGRFAYLTNYFDGTVSQYTIDQTSGALSPMTPATVSTDGTYAEAIAFDPSGKYAYVTFFGATPSAVVEQFRIDQTSGTLSPMSPSTVAAGGAGAAFITVDASGKYAYATSGETGWGSTTVAQYEVGPDGALTLMSPPTVTTGGSPWGVITIPR